MILAWIRDVIGEAETSLDTGRARTFMKSPIIYLPATLSHAKTADFSELVSPSPKTSLTRLISALVFQSLNLGSGKSNEVWKLQIILKISQKLCKWTLKENQNYFAKYTHHVLFEAELNLCLFNLLVLYFIWHTPSRILISQQKGCITFITSASHIHLTPLTASIKAQKPLMKIRQWY